MRTWYFAAFMAVAAAVAGLWVVYHLHQVSGWIVVVAAVPWVIVMLLRLTGGPKEL